MYTHILQTKPSFSHHSFWNQQNISYTNGRLVVITLLVLFFSLFWSFAPIWQLPSCILDCCYLQILQLKCQVHQNGPGRGYTNKNLKQQVLEKSFMYKLSLIYSNVLTLYKKNNILWKKINLVTIKKNTIIVFILVVFLVALPIQFFL